MAEMSVGLPKEYWLTPDPNPHPYPNPDPDPGPGKKKKKEDYWLTPCGHQWGPQQEEILLIGSGRN